MHTVTADQTFFDNSQQLKRIGYRAQAYLAITRHALRARVPLRSLISTRSPYRFADQPRPSSLSIEFTDACNLKCDYCTNPLFALPRAYMDDDVFESLLEQLDQFRIDRIRVGGGEATLHPKFAAYSSALAGRTRFLSVVTNAQWPKASIAAPLVEPYDLLEVSVDAGGAEHYEATRGGASFERLERNLAALLTERERVGSRALINIRLMVRPSSKQDERAEIDKWRSIADCVMPQYIIEQRGESGRDTYTPVQISTKAIPRCTLPFKDISVRSTGMVPVCQVNGSDLDETARHVLGDVRTDPLEELWSGSRMHEIRTAHRDRDPGPLNFCQGCAGR